MEASSKVCGHSGCMNIIIVLNICCTDRRIAAEHLPLGWTQHTEEEEDLLMKNLEELAKKFTTD